MKTRSVMWSLALSISFSAGCAIYTDISTYYGYITFYNNTESTVSIVTTRAEDSQAMYAEGFMESGIPPLASKECHVSWCPIAYTVLIIDVMDADANSWFDCLIASADGSKSVELVLNFIIDEDSQHISLSVYETSIKPEYASVEFAELLAMADDQEKALLEEFFDGYYEHETYRLDYDACQALTVNECILIIDRLDAIVEKYGFEGEARFLVILRDA